MSLLEKIGLRRAKNYRDSIFPKSEQILTDSARKLNMMPTHFGWITHTKDSEVRFGALLAIRRHNLENGVFTGAILHEYDAGGLLPTQVVAERIYGTSKPYGVIAEIRENDVFSKKPSEEVLTFAQNVGHILRSGGTQEGIRITSKGLILTPLTPTENSFLNNGLNSEYEGVRNDSYSDGSIMNRGRIYLSQIKYES